MLFSHQLKPSSHGKLQCATQGRLPGSYLVHLHTIPPKIIIMHFCFNIYNNVNWCQGHNLNIYKPPFTSTSLSPFITSRWRPGGGLPALKANSCVNVLNTFQTHRHKKAFVVWFINGSESFVVESEHICVSVMAATCFSFITDRTKPRKFKSVLFYVMLKVNM